MKSAGSFCSIFILIALIGFGAFYSNFRNQILPTNHISHFLNYSDLKITGFLIRDPIPKENRTGLQLQVTSVHLMDSSYTSDGKILVQVRDQKLPNMKYGNIVELEGELVRPRERRNPGGFDYRAYLARQSIHAILYVNQNDQLKIFVGQKGNPMLRSLIYPVRRRLLRNIDDLLPESTRPLLKTLLLGDRTELEDSMREAYARAGIVHILAVSGLHVGFIALILSFVLGLIRLPWKIRTVCVIFGLFFYVLLTEGKPPVFRAALMASIYLFGQILDRRNSPLNAIGAAGLVLLLINPAQLFDLGFQLSFTAVISILVFYPKISAWILPRIQIQTHWINQPLRAISSLIILTLSAQICTLPLTLSYFNRLPLLSLLFNTIAIPLAGLIVGLGFIFLLFAQFSLWIAGSFAMIAHLAIRLLNGLVQRTAALPFASVTLPTPDIWMLCLYILILFLFILWKQLQLRKILIIACIILLNGQIWTNVFINPDSKLTYFQLDVGQGDAALIRCPKHKTILVDGGPAYMTFDAGERIIAPYLIREGIRTIDLMICTHPHNDHVGGLNYILDNFKVKSVLFGPSPFESAEAATFLKRVKDRGIYSRIITAPDSVVCFPGLHLLFLSPDSSHITSGNKKQNSLNNQSIVTLLTYGKTSFLLAGDAEIEAEQSMLQHWRNLDCDLIKTGHHGSKTASSMEWIKAVTPEHALITVAEKNRYGLPDSIILDRYKQFDSIVHRTDKEGALMFESNGRTIQKLD
ncbi:DNA internalization-related competence protein ComEC/Rec2 [candidate division KSB1 bacterium]|nr:DNA internalization-related competence protein ComEC/Rec2 [candidate division KSB1 bacterium]